MTWVVVLAALGLGTLGFAMLSQATLGVGLICIACLVMIWARIVQAHEQELRRVATERLPATTTSSAEPVESKAAVNKTALGAAVLVVGAVVVALTQWQSLVPSAAPHSARDAYRVCAEHAAKAAGTSAAGVDPYDGSAVSAKADGRYNIAATVATESGAARSPFTCEAQWLSGSSYELIDLKLGASDTSK